MNDPRLDTIWQQHNLGPWNGSVTVTATRVRRGRQTSTPTSHLITVNCRWTGPSGPAFPDEDHAVSAAACITAENHEQAIAIARAAADALSAGRVPNLRQIAHLLPGHRVLVERDPVELGRSPGPVG